MEGRLNSFAYRFSLKDSSQRGNTTLLVIVGMGFLATLAYVVPTFIDMQKNKIAYDERSIHGQQLAGDIKEIGKYLLLYEKVVFKTDPLKLTTKRSAHLQKVWQQTFGAFDVDSSGLLNACGGFDALATYIGDLRLGGEPVFCPLYIRNSMMTGQMLEDMVFEKWNQPGSPVKILYAQDGLPATREGTIADVFKGSGGKYSTELDLTNSLDGAGNFIQLSNNPDFVRLLKSLKGEVKIRYDFYTDSSGFVGSGSDRVIKITGIVRMKSKPGEKDSNQEIREFKESESIILNNPTMKDFAIFMPYPIDRSWAQRRRIGPGVSDINLRPTPTHLMSKAINWGGVNTQIYGRVFFNGDIDTPLAQLPVFHDTVIITGNFTYQLTATDRELLKRKFLKGITTNFPANRFLFDGPYSSNRNCTLGSGPLDLSNVNGLHCRPETATASCAARDNRDDRCKIPAYEARREFGILEYMARSVCNDSVVIFGGGGAKGPENRSDSNWNYSFTNSAPENRPHSPDDTCPSNTLFVKGGAIRVEVNSTYAFIASPMAVLKVDQAGASIYGISMPGAIDVSTGPVNFYSLSRMKAGMTGIGSPETLDMLNLEASSLFELVGVPLSLPLVQTAREGMN